MVVVVVSSNPTFLPKKNQTTKAQSHKGRTTIMRKDWFTKKIARILIWVG